jgi:hypothetical protein
MKSWRMCVVLLLIAASGGAEDGPRLRHTNYAALLCAEGKETKLQLQSLAHSRNYADELSYALIGPDSNEVVSGRVPLGAGKAVAVTPKQTGLFALELESGWNLCTLDSGETPSGCIASEIHPLQIVGEIERLHFYVPKGCKRFSLFVTADVTSEAARIIVFSPEGQVVKEDEGDYDKRTAIKVAVPAGADDKAWSLSVAKPKGPGLGLDDVMLSLDPALPPFLSKRAEWAEMFGKRRHE